MLILDVTTGEIGRRTKDSREEQRESEGRKLIWGLNLLCSVCPALGLKTESTLSQQRWSINLSKGRKVLFTSSLISVNIFQNARPANSGGSELGAIIKQARARPLGGALPTRPDRLLHQRGSLRAPGHLLGALLAGSL